LLLVAGCGERAEDKVAAAPVDDRIECALDGTAEFARKCAIEQADGGSALTLRRADGGFRKLLVAADGGLSLADGAETLVGKALADGRLEVAIGGDRYRLPSGK
jgi:hypothetical protein